MWKWRLTWKGKCTRFWWGHFKRWAMFNFSFSHHIFLFHQFQECKQMWRTIYALYDQFKGYLASHDSLVWLHNAVHWEDLWPMSSKQVHKVIISKDFLWSSYNIHFVSNIINIIIIIFPLQCSSGFESFNSLSLLFKQQAFDHHPSQREGGRREIEHCLTGIGDLNQKCQDFPLESMCYISSDVEVFKVDSALSLMNGSEEKSAQGLGFKTWSMRWKLQLLIVAFYIKIASHRNRTRLWVSHMGHQTFKINEDLGQFLTEI